MADSGPRASRFRKRRNRWTDEVSTHIMSSVSAIPKYIPGGMTTEQIEALMVRVRIEELTRKLTLNELDIDYTAESRSPSPEPIYDQQGKRINTKEQRARERLLQERHDLVTMATAMFPNFRPPADYQPVTNKKMRKVMIPIEKHPEYNFIGLIIGPRGNTQKKMERETGCKISIRGKGSVKDGKKKDKNQNPDDNESLHVLLTADTEAQLEKATKMITDLLVPVEEGKNEHKRQQLRELALINGTLRDNAWMQPNSERTWEPAKVKCQICGEVSHPTSDCPMKGKSFTALPEEKQQELNTEYDKFLQEIGDSESGKKDAYDEFMEAIGEKKSDSSATELPPWQQQASQSANYGAVPPPWQQSIPNPWGTAPPPQTGTENIPPMDPSQQQQYPWAGYGMYPPPPWDPNQAPPR